MQHATVDPGSIGEDPSILELERVGADMLGKEAAIFLPTCSVANLLALMTLGERGTQAILDSNAHIVLHEAFGIAYVCGLMARLVDSGSGPLDSDAVERAIAHAKALNLPRTTIVCLENSHMASGGTVIDPLWTRLVSETAHRHGARVHLDGARIFNSAAALGVEARDLAAPADAVAVSLNKGLGAPYGALLLGSSEVIQVARVNASRLGVSSIHQAGMLAAAGLVALRTMTHRLADDNRRAAMLASALNTQASQLVDVQPAETNIVIVRVKSRTMTAETLTQELARLGVLAKPRPNGNVRFVIHSLISDADVGRTVEALASVLARDGRLQGAIKRTRTKGRAVPRGKGVPTVRNDSSGKVSRDPE